ncbi:energy-coupling factor transporter transmembrane component T family protein [Methanocella conradii]|uniref:energy-coupling factor transporter transmembrane component T family protein n=1 Tax=Methanocella conradii TaxID=1175444 RepID=UPI00157C6C58|nr:energy-coupling factor transporter transmembrane component T [Methanocella conradii]
MRVKYQDGDSALHRLDPVAKLAALSAFSICIFLFDSIAFEALSLGAILLAAYLIKAGPAVSIVRSRYAITLTIWLVVIQAIFTPAGSPLLVIPLHFFNVTVTDMGILKGLIISLRFLDVIAASGLFIATTGPAELAYALMRSGIPYRYGFMLVLMLRFMPVFEMEMGTVRDAQAARGLEVDQGGVKSLIKSIRYTFVPLIVSAISKVDCLVVSMEGRAFGYMPRRTFLHMKKPTFADMSIIATSIAIMAFLFLDRWGGWVPLPRLSV